MWWSALLACLLVVAGGGAHAQESRGLRNLQSDSSTGTSLTSGWKWTPGYVSATLADALAEVMRIKAESKFNKTLPTNILPTFTPSPSPSKSKTFAYTSIRLSTSASGSIFPPIPTPSPTPSPPAIIASVPAATTQSVSGAPAAASSTSVSGGPLETVPIPPAGRKLMGGGASGWDPGALFEQKLNDLGNAASALQQKVASEASSSTGSFDTKLTAADQTVGAITNYVGQAAMSHEDAVRAAIDAWQASAGTRAGDFQSMLMSLADAHSQLVADRLGLLG